MLAPIVGVTVITALHELAHCVAVWVQGGTVTDFSIIPTAQRFGYMAYYFDPGTPYSGELISAAPYLFWALLASVAAAFAWLRWTPSSLAATVFLWCYAVPLLDIGMHAVDYSMGSQNDFVGALGPVTDEATIALALAGLVTYAASFFVQRWIYRAQALSVRAYLAVSGISLLAISALIALIALITAAHGRIH